MLSYKEFLFFLPKAVRAGLTDVMNIYYIKMAALFMRVLKARTKSN